MTFIPVRFCDNTSISNVVTYIRDNRILEFREATEAERKKHKHAKSRIVYEDVHFETTMTSFVDIPIEALKKALV